MTDPRDLGEQLRAAVPETPPRPDRAQLAVARARRTRRNRGIVVVAASVLAIAGTLVGVDRLGGEAGPPVSGPSADATGEVPDVDCPEPVRRGDPAPPQQADAGPLPPGPLVVRLCSIAAGDFGGFTPPADALVTGVADLAELIDSMPKADLSEPICAAAGRSYSLVFGYADGTERVVQAENGPCAAHVRGVGVVRTGGVELWHEFIAALRDQRANQDGPYAIADFNVTCPGADGSNPWDHTPTATLTPDAVGRLCWRRKDTETVAEWAGIRLSKRQLSTLVSDLTDPANTHRPTEQECREATLQFALVTVDHWGDRSLVLGDCGGFTISTERRDVERRPSSDVQAMIDALVDRAGSAALPTASPQDGPREIVALIADLLGDDRRAEAEALTLDPSLIDVDGVLDVKPGNVRRLPAPPALSGYDQYVEVESLWGVVGTDGSWEDGDYHQVHLGLVRDRGEVWRLATLTDLGPVSLGR